MWVRAFSRLVGTTILYFALYGVLAVLHELFQYSAVTQHILLFPAAKLLGDTLFTILRGARLHAFWEEWIAESFRFVLLGLAALVCASFWKAVLGLNEVPSLVPVAAILYLITDWVRKGERPQGELS